MKKLILVLALTLSPMVNAASDLENLIATVINLKGYLCANVTMLYPQGTHKYEVVCKEYRHSRGKVSYFVNMQSMQVRKI